MEAEGVEGGGGGEGTESDPQTSSLPASMETKSPIKVKEQRRKALERGTGGRPCSLRAELKLP